MNDDKLLGLLAQISSAEDEIRRASRTPEDRERSRSQLISSVETLDQDDSPLLSPVGRFDEFAHAQLAELLGPIAAWRALELAAAAVGQRPEAWTWEMLDEVVAALRPPLVDLLGAEIAGSELERLCLTAVAARRS